MKNSHFFFPMRVHVDRNWPISRDIVWELHALGDGLVDLRNISKSPATEHTGTEVGQRKRSRHKYNYILYIFNIIYRTSLEIALTGQQTC